MTDDKSALPLSVGVAGAVGPSSLQSICSEESEVLPQVLEGRPSTGLNIKSGVGTSPLSAFWGWMYESFWCRKSFS